MLVICLSECGMPKLVQVPVGGKMQQPLILLAGRLVCKGYAGLLNPQTEHSPRTAPTVLMHRYNQEMAVASDWAPTRLTTDDKHRRALHLEHTSCDGLNAIAANTLLLSSSGCRLVRLMGKPIHLHSVAFSLCLDAQE